MTIPVNNPIERLWKVMNEKSRNNVYFKRKRDFKAAIDQFFAVTLPEIAGSLASRINDNFRFSSLHLEVV
jgi:transposase